MARGDREAARRLLEQGADAQAEDAEGRSALALALERKDEKMATALVEKLVERMPRSEEEAKQLAALEQRFARGEKVDLDKSLIAAAKVGQVGGAHLLLGMGASANAQTVIDGGRFAVLGTAAALGRRGVVELLLKHGANPNAANTPTGGTALHQVAFSGDVAVARVLVAAGADVNAQTTNRAGRYAPLHDAAMNGNTDMVEFLLVKGAEVDPRSRRGETPLHLAASRGHMKVVTRLLAFGADPRAKDKAGATPAQAAKDKEVAKLLAAFEARKTPGGARKHPPTRTTRAAYKSMVAAAKVRDRARFMACFCKATREKLPELEKMRREAARLDPDNRSFQKDFAEAGMEEIRARKGEVVFGEEKLHGDKATLVVNWGDTQKTVEFAKEGGVWKIVLPIPEDALEQALKELEELRKKKSTARKHPKAGTPHPKHPNLVADGKGNLGPAPGYKWLNDAPDNMRVVWAPGKTHTQHPHVVAAAREGGWRVAPGYKWASDKPGDLRVVPEVKWTRYRAARGRLKGLSFVCPATWTVKDIPGGYGLVPPDLATRNGRPVEAFSVLADPVAHLGVTRIDDPRVLPLLDALMRTAAPGFRRVGTIRAARMAKGKGIVADWEGIGLGGIPMRARIFAGILRGHVVMLFAMGPKARMAARDPVLHGIFASFSF